METRTHRMNCGHLKSTRVTGSQWRILSRVALQDQQLPAPDTRSLTCPCRSDTTPQATTAAQKRLHCLCGCPRICFLFTWQASLLFLQTYVMPLSSLSGCQLLLPPLSPGNTAWEAERPTQMVGDGVSPCLDHIHPGSQMHTQGPSR